jgi:hypothetical protein
MNDGTISINLYDIEEPDSFNVKNTETAIQDAYPTTLLMDDGSKDLDANGMKDGDDAL